MTAKVAVEVIPDEEYALWEQAVADAEQQNLQRSLSRALQPAPLLSHCATPQDRDTLSADQEICSAVEAVLPYLEAFGLKVNSRAKHRPRGLRVTDITGAEWCQQQLAFALSARLPKASSCVTCIKQKAPACLS